MTWQIYTYCVLFMWCVDLTYKCYGQSISGLTLSNQLKNIVNNGLGANYVQNEFDKLAYTSYPLDGPALIQELGTTLGSKFQSRITALKNIKQVVEQQYSSFSSSGSTKQCCSSTGLEYNALFKGQVDVNDYCNMISGTASSGRKLANAAVYNQMKANLNADSTLKWQYYGSEEGVLINYPKIKQSSCTSYDPRYRPWYVETATPKPKDVVIVIDTSGSMGSLYNGRSYMAIAQDAAKTVLETLNPNDKVGIVAFSSTARRPPGQASTSTCYSSTLALATPQNIKYLKSYISTLYANGGTYYGLAMTAAFDLIQNSPLYGEMRGNTNNTTEEGDDQVIIFLTDGAPSDGNSALSVIRDQNHALNNRVVVMTFGIGSSVQTSAILTSMGNQDLNSVSYGPIRRTTYTWVSDLDNLRSNMAGFYSFFSSSEEIIDPIFSVPYQDAFGIGLVTSACLPIYVGNLKGVACVDIPVPELLEDVTYFQQGELSYAFITDSRGRALTHPLLPKPKDKGDDPIFVFAADLERSAGAEEILASMRRSESGNKTILSTRSFARGDVNKEGVHTRSGVLSHYFWYPIGYNNFSVCIVVGDNDRQARLNTLSVSNDADTFTYHRLDLKNSGTTCKHFQRLARKDTSTVMLTATAFKDPSNYFERNDSLSDVNAYELYFRGQSNSLSSNPVKDNVRNSVVATKVGNTFWTSSSNTASSYVVWRAIGTIEGIMRVYPGVQLAKDYNHQLRPWWKRTLANKGKNTVSAPYLDAWGAGYIITLAYAIYEGRANNQHTTNDQVVAIMSADISVTYFYGMLQEQFTDCRSSMYSCFVMDSSGYLVIHDDFVSVPSNPAKPFIEGIHLMVKEPAIARDLISKNVMTTSACINFEGIQNRHYWTVSVSSVTYPGGIIQNINGVPSYELHTVADSNVFVVIKSTDAAKVGSGSSCTCQDSGQTDTQCTSTSVSYCQCPCWTKAHYLYCNNTFDTSSDNWPTCPPKVPDISSVKLEANSTSKAVCFDAGCSSKSDKFLCYASAGCNWCTINKDNSVISSPYCANQDVCYYGKVGQSSPYNTTSNGKGGDKDEGLSGGAIAGIVIGSLVVAGGLVYMINKHNKTKAASTRTPAATTNAQSTVTPTTTVPGPAPSPLAYPTHPAPQTQTGYINTAYNDHVGVSPSTGYPPDVALYTGGPAPSAPPPSYDSMYIKT